MEDVVGVEVGDADEELVEEGFEDAGGDGLADGLGVVVDDLLQGVTSSVS